MKAFHFLICLLAAFGLFSCSQDEVFIEETQSKGLTAEIPSYQFENSTRVFISNDLQAFTWSTGDQIGVYASDANVDAGAWFKIKQGGSSTGNFENNLFKLDAANTYYAFYPFSSTATVTSATVSFTGQKQAANNSASHLGAYNYMYGNVEVGSNGNASVQFQNIGAVMQVKLTVDKAGIYKTLQVTSDNAKFITKGTASMKTGVIKSTDTSSFVSLTLGSGFALNAGDELIANILVAPVDMSGSNLTLSLVDADGEESSVVVSGKEMKAGKAYRFMGEFMESGGNTYLGHEYVDLGIIDENGNKVLWATTNVGADNPWEYGNYYAWGETKAYGEEDTSNTHNFTYGNTYKKTYYSWETYKWATGSDEYSISKYSCADGDTNAPWYQEDGTYIGLNGVKNQTKLEPEDDAAHVNWGNGWRMPTSTEFQLLFNNCYWKWVTEYKGHTVNGYIVYKAKADEDKGYWWGNNCSASYSVSTDAHIFLPAAGIRDNNNLECAGDYGIYRSSELCGILFISTGSVCPLASNRYMGESVRPVRVVQN